MPCPSYLSNCSVPNVNNNAAVWFEVYSKIGDSYFQEITSVIAEMESQWGLVGFFKISYYQFGFKLCGEKN